MTQPNFFDLLEIDPSDPLSEADLEALLEKKGAEWTRKARNPKDGVRYQGYRELIPDIRAALLDPERRRVQADAYHGLLKSKKEAAIKQLEISAGLDATKGYITPPQVTRLAKASIGVLDEDDVRTQLGRMGIPVRAAVVAPNYDPAVAAIARSTMQDIRAKLNTLGMDSTATLYDFLQLADSTDTHTLLQAAADIYKAAQDNPNKTAEVTARSELSGHGMSIFKTEVSREQYKVALEQQLYEDVLNKQVTHLLSGEEKRISAQQYTMLLEMVASAGLDVDRASAYIQKRAQQMGGVVEIAGVDAVKEKLRCPSCNSLNPTEAHYCTHCNSRLKMPCPACQTVILTNSRACMHCGFPVGNVINVQRLVADARQRIVEQDYTTARRLLQSAQQQWTSPKGQKLNDPITHDLHKLLKDVETEFTRQQDIQMRLLTAINERRFYAARAILSPLPPEAFTLERGRVDNAIEKAERDVLAVRNSDSSSDSSVDLYRAILLQCKDCQMALDALAQTPPLAPSLLRAARNDTIISLQWQPSPARDVRYTIVRKYNSRPVAAHDGEQVATVSGTQYDDTTAEPGLSVYYAVYTNRDTVLSHDAAMLTEPVLLTPGVESVIVAVDDGEIRLSWSPPPNVASVTVKRLVNQAPQSHLEGEDVPVIGNSQVVDQRLHNDNRYYYTIVAFYQRHDGQKQGSNGVVVSAIPTQPPVPPEINVRVLGDAPKKRLHVSWPRPSKGDVAVLRQNTPFSFQPGDIIPQEQMSSMVLVGGQQNQLETPIQEMEAVYLLPVVFFQGMAYVGKSLRYVNLEDVRQVRWQRHRTGIQLRWEWPLYCHQASVSYAYDHYPEDDDPNSVTLDVTKGEYDLRGYVTINTEGERDYYVVVRAVMTVDGRRMIAAGRHNEARARVSLSSRMTIRYTVDAVKSGRFLSRGKQAHRQPVLHIQVEGKGTLPELLVIGKKQSVPVGKTDGEVMMRLDALDLYDESHTFEYALEQPASSGTMVKLFLVDDGLYDSQGGYVRILHPPMDDLRLTK